MHDLVIRNGSIIDGTGAPAFSGGVAFDAGHMGVSLSARVRSIDAVAETHPGLQPRG